MMKFVAAKTINAIYWNTYIVTASHDWRCRCGLVRAQFAAVNYQNHEFSRFADCQDWDHSVMVLSILPNRKIL